MNGAGDEIFVQKLKNLQLLKTNNENYLIYCLINKQYLKKHLFVKFFKNSYKANFMDFLSSSSFIFPNFIYTALPLGLMMTV